MEKSPARMADEVSKNYQPLCSTSITSLKIVRISGEFCNVGGRYRHKPDSGLALFCFLDADYPAIRVFLLGLYICVSIRSGLYIYGYCSLFIY